MPFCHRLWTCSGVSDPGFGDCVRAVDPVVGVLGLTEAVFPINFSYLAFNPALSPCVAAMTAAFEGEADLTLSGEPVRLPPPGDGDVTAAAAVTFEPALRGAGEPVRPAGGGLAGSLVCGDLAFLSGFA